MRAKRGELSKRKNAPLDGAIDKLGTKPKQEDIIKFISKTGFTTASGKFQHDFSSDHIQRLLRMLYSSDEPEGLDFYSQARDGLPTAKVETRIAGTTLHPKVALINNLNPTPWHWTQRPDRFPKEAKWPPEEVFHLLGCAPMEDWCLECHSTIRSDAPSDEYMLWRGKMFTFWLENLRIYVSRKYGFGVRAMNEIPQNTILGEYTGDLVPEKPKVSHEITQYHFDIDIGKDPDGDKEQADCWLDATKRGSILRFVNHSCDPNALAKLGRCSIHNRVVFMVTTRDIEENEPISIDYGKEWFATDDEPCLCGSSNCRNPPKKGDDKKEPKHDGKTSRGGKAPKKPEEWSKVAEKKAKATDKEEKGTQDDEQVEKLESSTQTKAKITKGPKKQDEASKEKKEAKESDQTSKTRGQGSKHPGKGDGEGRNAKEGKQPQASKATKEKVAKQPQKQNSASENREEVDTPESAPETGKEVSKKPTREEEKATETGKKIGNTERLRMMKVKSAKKRESKSAPPTRRTSPRLAAASASGAAKETTRKRPHVEEPDSDEEVRPPKEKVRHKEESARPKAPRAAKEPARKRARAEDDDEELQPPRKKATQKTDVKRRNR